VARLGNSDTDRGQNLWQNVDAVYQMLRIVPIGGRGSIELSRLSGDGTQRPVRQIVALASATCHRLPGSGISVPSPALRGDGKGLLWS